jgi:hypothetical protein
LKLPLRSILLTSLFLAILAAVVSLSFAFYKGFFTELAKPLPGESGAPASGVRAPK